MQRAQRERCVGTRVLHVWCRSSQREHATARAAQRQGGAADTREGGSCWAGAATQPPAALATTRPTARQGRASPVLPSHPTRWLRMRVHYGRGVRGIRLRSHVSPCSTYPRAPWHYAQCLCGRATRSTSAPSRLPPPVPRPPAAPAAPPPPTPCRSWPSRPSAPSLRRRSGAPCHRRYRRRLRRRSIPPARRRRRRPIRGNRCTVVPGYY